MNVVKLPSLKPSIFYYANSSSKLGFNLDKWLHLELINLGIIPSNTVCCKTNNLFLKGGFVFKGTQEGFSFNKNLRKLLYRLSVITNDYCCIKQTIKIPYSEIYYTKTDKNGLNLMNWLKKKLTSYSISFTDPCC